MGCSDKVKVDEISTASCSNAVSDVKLASQPSANVKDDVPVLHGATPEEAAHIKACQIAIDDGRNALAVRHAREFMDSTNAEVRLQAVEAFGWIGKVAIRELAEMMADPDEEVASEAQRQWEMAFDELSSEGAKMREVERTAVFVKDQSQIEAVMLKLVELEDYNSVKVLGDIITSTNSTPVAAEVAREEYVLLAGEPFVDPIRTEQVAKALRDRADGVPPEPTENTEQADLQKKGTK